MESRKNLLEYTNMEEAYAAIAGFFDSWSLSSSRHFLYKTLRSASDKKACKLNASNVLFFFKSLGSLVNAALKIHHGGYQKEEAILETGLDELPGPGNYAQYFGWQNQPHQWNYFPRALSKKEYFNPYRVFNKMADYANDAEWKFILEELQDFTFFNSSFSESTQIYNILEVHHLLDKMLEAAHLVDVRSIWEVNGRSRPKWKGFEREEISFYFFR